MYEARVCMCGCGMEFFAGQDRRRYFARSHKENDRKKRVRKMQPDAFRKGPLCACGCGIQCFYARGVYVSNHVRTHKERIIAEERAARGAHCEVCGNEEGLHWHHLRDKVFEISSVIKVTAAGLMAELSKCQLICKGCHRRTHNSLKSRGRVEFQLPLQLE